MSDYRNRIKGLLTNPIAQIGLGGLLGGLQGQNPMQSLLGTGSQVMQLGGVLEKQNALKQLSENPNLTPLQKQLFQIAPTEVAKSLLAEKKVLPTMLSPESIAKLKLPAGTIAYNTEKGLDIKYKPEGSIVKQRAELKTTANLVDKISNTYVELGKPVGAFGMDLDRIKGNIGKPFGSQYSKDYKRLGSYIDQTQTFLTKAISGAQVSEQEAERIKGLIPQLSDSEVVFEAKAIALKEYLTDAQKNYGADITSAIENIDISKYEKIIKKDKVIAGDIEIGDDGIYDVTGG
tara:strand:- start:1952 stop:2821 length:870 start_codon:yes stop_codon:yes gene_type:complete